MQEDPTSEGLYLLDKKPIQLAGCVPSHNNFRIAWLHAGDGSFKFLPYQLSMVGSRPTMAFTGNGELGFDSGEGA